MGLTEKDLEFLVRLQRLMDSEDLEVELTPGRPSYMVLRRTYAKKINVAFGITRQGVRWRFWRIFNQIYVEAFSTIFVIEKTFGTGLRDHAIRISKERHALRQDLAQTGLEAIAGMLSRFRADRE